MPLDGVEQMFQKSFARSLALVSFSFFIVICYYIKVQWLCKIKTFLKGIYMLVFHISSVLPGLSYCDWITRNRCREIIIKNQQKETALDILEESV